MALYRNNDRAFEALLARKSAERKIYIVIEMEPVIGNKFREEPQGVKAVVNIMKTKEADGGLIYQVAEVFKELKLEKAKRPQGENIKAQMSKLGDLRSLPGRTSEGNGDILCSEQYSHCYPA